MDTDHKDENWQSRIESAATTVALQIDAGGVQYKSGFRQQVIWA